MFFHKPTKKKNHKHIRVFEKTSMVPVYSTYTQAPYLPFQRKRGWLKQTLNITKVTIEKIRIQRCLGILYTVFWKYSSFSSNTNY